jgi:hypothetical protein
MYTPLPLFDPWMLTNPTLPKLYWEAKSPEQLIANLYCIIDAIKDPLNNTIGLSSKNAETIEEIEKVIESIENGQYYDRYIDGLAKWIDANLQQLVARQSKFVFPTFYQEPDTGVVRYALVIPRGWDHLKFDWFFDERDNTYHVRINY